MLEQAEAVLRGWRRANLTKLINYKRGDVSVSINATQGDTNTDELADEVLTRGERIDWIVEKIDLGVLEKPEPGDVVQYDSARYVVCDLGDGRCFRRHGRDGLSLRIHSKRVV